MSEQKRASLTTIGTANSEKKREVAPKKSIRLGITLTEPNEDSCPVLDYTKLCRSEEKKQLLKKKKQNKPNGTLLPFDDDDDDIRRIARQFEEKYGTSDKKRQRCQTYAELGAGYDETDSFIDNTDAYDEALPEELQTPCGGYYINSGRLEFKKVEMSDHSDIDEIIARRRKRGLNVMEDDEEEDDEENEASDNKVEEEPKKEEILPTVPKKVKISEDKPTEQIPVVNDKDKVLVASTPEPDSEHSKAKKRKLQMQGILEETPVMKQKKKALTVKALLEEKRVSVEPTGTEEQKKPVTATPTSNYTSINDVIESVIRGNDDSNSSSGVSKSHSGSLPSSESEDSQQGKPPNNSSLVTPLPDPLPAEILEVVYRIRHLASTTSDLKRKFLSEDINNALVNLEWKARDLPRDYKTSLYSHLSYYLPCTKETLVKRTKKLIIQREEEKMKEPMKKLKAAVDAMMPVLLEKYNKDCQRLAEEQALDGSNNTSSKVARRKFPWNDELRSYLREVITVQLNCFNVLKLRKETSEAYVSKYLNTHVRVLWPPGWMKTSTLLREGRGSSVVVKSKKHSSNGIESSSKNVNNTPRLTLPSLPSSTTLTPSNGTILPTYSRSEPNNYQHKLPTSTSMIPSTTTGSKSNMIDSTNLLSKMSSLSSSISPPKKSHSPGSSVTISPVKKESFSVDALLKKNIESCYAELTDVKKDSVSVITVNGAPTPLPLMKVKKEECNSNSNSSGDKILDLSNNCSTKQHHSVIQNTPLNDRTTVTNGESVNLSSSEDVKPVNNNSVSSSKPKEAMTSFLMSRKQRILQDSQSDEVIKTTLAQEPTRHNEPTANNIVVRKHKKSESKKKHKNEHDKESLIPPPISKCIKSPPPYISSQEAERRLNEETATATDILSQIISESLLATATPHQHQRSFEEEIPEERKVKPRTMSGEQEAKVNQEVDQVIQDLVELRQMSGGSTDNTIENSKNNHNSNPLGLHHGKSHIETESHETTKLSPYSGFQDEFFKHLLMKDTPLPNLTKPTPLPRHSISPFDNSYTDDIPSKSSMYNSLPLHSNQSMSQHILPPSSKSAQINHGNTSSLSLNTAGHPHRPVYFPQLGFSNDDQHLLGLQFGWPFPGSSESSPPH